MNATAPQPLATAFPARPKPVKLAHVVLRTPRFQEMKAFYAQLLCAAPAYENEQLTFMTYDEEHHRIGIINMPHLGPADKSAAGLEHVAFTYADLPSLLAAYVHNRDGGIRPFWTINHGPTVSFYYRDPDGNKVELQYDTFPTVEGLNAFFASGAYEENFMGIIFDPEQMVADYEAGVPVETLIQRPRLPEGVTPWDMHRD